MDSKNNLNERTGWHTLLFLAALLLFSGSVFGQERFEVKGSVIDNSDNLGGTLAGVSVREEGTNNAAVTTGNGNFSLEVSSPLAVLTFTFIGYETVKVEVRGRENIEVGMHPTTQELSDVIVTALGINRQKRSLGYSVDEISSDDVDRVPHEDVITSLAGKVTGVAINQTGGTGSSISMVIRGAYSLSNDNQPLYVVDGVPINNTLNNVADNGDNNRVDFGDAISSLNPSDIESISILKGPSAAALYGGRAGNGVVLITTKDGSQSHKLTVTVNSATVFDIPNDWVKMQQIYAEGPFPSIPVSISGNPLTDPFDEIFDPTYGAFFGAELDQGYEAVQFNSPLDSAGNPIPLPLVSHPNNIRNFLQTGITSQNGISLSNSTGNMNYRISYSNMQNRGVIPKSNLFRNTFNINSSVKINSKLKLSSTITANRNHSNSRPATGRGANPLYHLYQVGPQTDIMDLKEYWVPGQEGMQQKTVSIGKKNNPWFLANEVKNSYTRDGLYGNLKLDWQILSNLKLMLRYGLDTYNEKRELRTSQSYTEFPNGSYALHHLKRFESNADFLATYTKDFNDFSLSASFGGNIRDLHYENSSTSVSSESGLIVPNVFTLSNILPSLTINSSNISEKRVHSLYGMATLGYKDMVYLDVTGRNDWSSTLPFADPFFYPSSSLSILIDEITGIHSKYINMIKLRGGVAQVGNDASAYQLEQVLTSSGSYKSIPRLSMSNALLNPTLRPEKITSYEGGLDVELLGRGLRFSFTYYIVDDRDQIFAAEIPSSTGFSTKNINAGLVRSRGVEMKLGLAPLQTENWFGGIQFNFTRNRTRIMELPNEMPFFQFWDEAHGGAWTYVGEDVGDIYGAELRVVEDEKSPYYGYPLLKSAADGGFEWAYSEAHNSRNKIGNFNPDFILGTQVSLKFKNWSLNATFDWRKGGDFVSRTFQYGMENGYSVYQYKQFIEPGNLRGRELRDFLVAHADEYIIPHGNFFPRIGSPSLNGTSYPFSFGGFNLPYGGLIIPGVYEDPDHPGEYLENLGENILNLDPDNPNHTGPVPAAAVNPWHFIQSILFPADNLKLREIALSYTFPEKWLKGIGINSTTFSVFSRNIMLWTKAGIGIDPENAFAPNRIQNGGSMFQQGLEYYSNYPHLVPVGVKLNVVF